MPTESSFDPASRQDVLLYVGEEGADAAKDEVSDLGGRVTHQFGDNVLIARMPGAADAARMTSALMEARTELDFLANAEPRANLSFVYDIQPVTVTVAPGPAAGVSGVHERYERPWRDAALAQMGFASGRDGYRAYVSDLRQRMGTD